MFNIFYRELDDEVGMGEIDVKVRLINVMFERRIYIIFINDEILFLD